MTRTERLIAGMAELGVDAVVISTPVHLDYFFGFPEDGHERFLAVFVLASGEIVPIVPGLSANQAQRVGLTNVKAWTDGDDPMEFVAELAQEASLKAGIFAVDPELRSDHLLRLQDVLPAALFRSAEPILTAITRQKDADELNRLTESGVIADQIFEALTVHLRAGQTERELAAWIKDRFSAHGATPTFAIIATGANGAEPHHENDNTPLKSGDVAVLDFGAEWRGYQSDITRTVSLGEPTNPEADRVYEIVYRAHEAAREAVRPGVTGAEVDAAARRVIEEAGYGAFFPHRTGHGLGRRGHESPNIVSTNHEPLEVGDCFSIEPGIYLPDRFGVRLENIYTVAESGAVSFNAPISPTLRRIPS